MKRRNKYNNLLDKNGFEVIPSLVQNCVIWLVGGAVQINYDDWCNDNDIDNKSPKRDYLTFCAKLKLFGNKKSTLIRYDIPEEHQQTTESCFKWGVEELVKNFRLMLDEEVNNLMRN